MAGEKSAGQRLLQAAAEARAIARHRTFHPMHIIRLTTMSGDPTYVVAEKVTAVHADTDYTTDKKPTLVYLEGTDPFWVSETPEQVQETIDSAMRRR